LTDDTTNEGEVAKVTRSNGVIAARANAGTSQKNYCGNSITGYEPFWTAPYDNYVYRFNTSNMGTYNDGVWNYDQLPPPHPNPSGRSINLSGTTDGYLLVRRGGASRYIYGGCGSRVYKLDRNTGANAADADADGEEWNDVRVLGSRISTSMIGSSDRRVFMFGTEGGFVYIMNDNNAYPAATPAEQNPTYSGLGYDGSPVPGYPYRIVGGQLLSMTAAGSGAGTRIFFVVGQPGQVKLYCFQLP
jgi:hypothetical protein